MLAQVRRNLSDLRWSVRLHIDSQPTSPNKPVPTPRSGRRQICRKAGRMAATMVAALGGKDDWGRLGRYWAGCGQDQRDKRYLSSDVVCDRREQARRHDQRSTSDFRTGDPVLVRQAEQACPVKPRRGDSRMNGVSQAGRVPWGSFDDASCAGARKNVRRLSSGLNTVCWALPAHL